MIRFRDLLKNRNFCFLWIGQVVSNFGDRLNQMALVALVYQNSPGSEMALAKLISFTIIPVFIIGPVAGAWVDRLNKRHVMMTADIVRGFLVLLIPLCIASKQILIIYLIIFITFSLSRFFVPSKMAIIPDIVSKDNLLLANTMQNTTHMIGNVVGLVAAGIIVNISFIGAVGGFYIDAATFFVSAAFVGMMVYGKSKGAGEEIREDIVVTGAALKESIRTSILREIKDGLQYILKYRSIRFIMYTMFLLLAGIGAISCVIIVFIQSAFGTATRDLGFLGMFLVFGLFAGTLLFGRFGQRMNKFKAIQYSFIASGIILIAFSLSVRYIPNLAVTGIAAFILGITISPVMASTNTLTHELIPEDVRGRIFSSIEVVIHFAFLLCMFIAAFLTKYIDRLWILIGVGIVFCLSGIAGGIIKRKLEATSS